MARLRFKWGTLKGWDGIEGECLELLKEYFKDGINMSCAADTPDETRREVLCRLIDKFDGEMHNDWTGEKMTKEEAKKYVTEYAA